MKTLSLFENERLSLERSIDLSAESLRHYGSLYKHWAIAFSGGKDSSATVTLVADLIDKGLIPRPASLTVLYADTRQELPPGIESEVNIGALRMGQPELSLINAEELARIQELIEAETWPDKWSGTEHRGDKPFDEIYPDGSIQPLLFT